MNNHNSQNPQVAYSEMEFKAVITDIEKRVDKYQNDYWVIRTLSGPVRKSFLAFSKDYNIAPKTAYLLLNFEQLIGKTATLTIRTKNDQEKVTEIVLEK